MKKTFTLLTLLILIFVKTNAQVTANAGQDKEICKNDTLKITGSGLSQGDVGTYEWKDLSNNSVVSNTEFLNIKLTFVGTKNYELKVTKTVNTTTYTDYDSVQVIVNDLPSMTHSAIPPRCYTDGKLLLNMAKANNANEDKIHYWNKRNWITGGPAGQNWYYYDYPKYIGNSQVPSIGLRDTIWYSYSNPNTGCYNFNRIIIRINPNPSARINNGSFCQSAGNIDLSSLIQVPIPAVRMGGISSFRVLKVPNGSGVTSDSILSEDLSTNPRKWYLNPGNSGDNHRRGIYTVEFCFQDGMTGCKTCDSAEVNVISLPEIKFDSIPNQCSNWTYLDLDSFVKNKNTGKRFPNGQWKAIEYNESRHDSFQNLLNSTIVNNKIFYSTTAGKYLLKFSDNSSGCNIADSTEIIVNGLPQIILNVPDTIWSNEDTVIFNSNYPNNINGNWLGEGISSEGKLLTKNINFQNKKYISKNYVYCYTNPNTNCSNCDSIEVTFVNLNSNINSIHNNSILIYPNPVSETLYITQKEQIKTLKVYNSLGQMVYFNDLFFEKIITKDWTNGVYYLEVNAGNDIYQIKIIKY